MAQGSKYSDEIKEQALALLVSKSLQEVSKQLKIPERTLRDWRDNEEKINAEFAQLRKEKKREFATKSWQLIEKANKILEIRLDRELNDEATIEALIKSLKENPEITQEEVIALRKAFQRIRIDSISQLTTMIGTLYDKQALVNKEATVNHGATKSLEDILKGLQGDEM